MREIMMVRRVMGIQIRFMDRHSMMQDCPVVYLGGLKDYLAVNKMIGF